MAKPRTVHDSGFEARVALEALKERETVGQLAKRHGVPPTQIHEWKRRLLDQSSLVGAASSQMQFEVADYLRKTSLGVL